MMRGDIIVNLITQKISREWSKLRALDYTNEIYFDNEQLILTKFNQVKPMILKAVGNGSIQAIKDWMREHALGYGRQDDIKNRNIWLDLRECFDFLEECDLLPMHNGELK